jgi:hypothetical protein
MERSGIREDRRTERRHSAPVHTGYRRRCSHNSAQRSAGVSDAPKQPDRAPTRFRTHGLSPACGRGPSRAQAWSMLHCAMNHIAFVTYAARFATAGHHESAHRRGTCLSNQYWLRRWLRKAHVNIKG